jgi:hypothetical protein
VARIRLKGINSRSKTLADGSLVTYWYAWKGGPRLKGELGVEPQEVVLGKADAADRYFGL